MVEYMPRSAWTTTAPGGGTLTGSQLVGVACHWPGTTQSAIGDPGPRAIADRLREYRNYHVNVRGWSDIGYQVAGDQAGRVWDLRGITRIPAAHASESNPDANLEFGAFLFLVGQSEQPSPALIEAFQHWRFTRWLERWPNAEDVRGHGYGSNVGLPRYAVPGAQTNCPGVRVHNLIVAGTLSKRPGTPTENGDDDMPTANEIEAAVKNGTLQALREFYAHQHVPVGNESETLLQAIGRQRNDVNKLLRLELERQEAAGT